MKDLSGKTNLFKKLGWTSLGLCGLCCTLPLIGGVIGIGSLSVIAFYVEKISIFILGIIIVFFTSRYIMKKQKAKQCSTSCDVNCQCSTEALSRDS